MSRLSAAAAAATLHLAALLSLAPPALAAQSAPTADEGVRLFNAKQYERAGAVFRPLAAGGKNAVAEYYLGRIDLESNRAEAATEHLERAVALDGKSSDYHLWLGHAYGTRAQHSNVFGQAMLAPKAKGEFERAVELDPRNIDARAALMQFYAIAPGVMGGSVDKAREQVQAVKQINPYRGALMAINFDRQTNNSAALEADLRAALAAYPDSVPVFAAAVSSLQDASRHAEAWAMLDERLKARPDDQLSLFLVGRGGAISGQQLGRAESALHRYAAADHVPPMPTSASAHYRLGMVLEKKGDRAGAKAEYESALRIEPKLKAAKDALERVK